MILLCMAVVWLGFRLTENGVFTVIDYSADPQEIATYRHFGFAASRLNELDPKAPGCIVNGDGKVVAIRSGVVDFSGKPVTENTDYATERENRGI